MKTTAPQSQEEYFAATEHAVKHLYAGLDSCWSYYKEAGQYWDLRQLGQPMTPERREALNNFLELAKKYFSLKFSEATFAGGILQTAYMGIRLYSRNDSIPASCAGLVRPENKSAIPFCIGEYRHGLPLGLIVYAGRNQFSHWDEDKLNPVNENVFEALSLAHFTDVWHDLAFSLSNPTINIYAGEILLVALRWTTYDEYLTAMKAMLTSPADAEGTD